LDERTSAEKNTNQRPLRVAWLTYFPVEWLPNPPPQLANVPKEHPATWQRVLCDELQKRDDLDLHIIALRNSFRESFRFRRGNTTFHCIKTPRGMRSTSFYWLDTQLVAGELKEIQPDLLHAWGTEFGSAAVAARLKYPALVTMQGILTWLAKSFKLNFTHRLSQVLENGSLRKAHVVTCESRFAVNYLHEHHPHLKVLQVEHAPNPIFSRVMRRVQGAPVRLLGVGGFDAGKGADIVVKALDKFGDSLDFELIWVGHRNPEFEEDLNLSEALWKRVTFRHGLSPEDVAEELSKATLFLHAARADNSPNAVKEAVVAGVPVVATRTGGIPDYIFPGKNGLMFESGDVEDCYAKIKAALEHPLLGKGRVEEQTLAEVRSYLSAETMAAKFMAAYRVALETDPRAKRV
jgi:glycosyltransferase involved in cell wall biosynthesis